MDRMTVADLLVEARAHIMRHMPAAAARAVENGAVLIDLRCSTDRETDGAIPIPSTVLKWRADPESAWKDDRIADLGARLILMCNDGYSSSLAAANLVKIGFTQAGDVVGGFQAWKSAGLPVIARRATPTPRWR